MMMQASRTLAATAAARHARGMTLIEVLVGIAIGLVGMLVMFQTLTVWDARTRATTAGGDAQIAGSIAMYTLERDLKLAGMGFGDADTGEVSCLANVVGFDNTASAPVGFPFKPVMIVDNDLTGLPDEVAVLYGNSPFFVTKESYTNATATSVRTLSRVGFRAGDLAIVTDRACNQRLVEVTDEPTTADDKTLSHTFGDYAHFYTNGASRPVRYNQAAGLRGRLHRRQRLQPRARAQARQLAHRGRHAGLQRRHRRHGVFRGGRRRDRPEGPVRRGQQRRRPGGCHRVDQGRRRRTGRACARSAWPCW